MDKNFALPVIGLVFALGAGSAEAQAIRTFVSGHGTDTGACALTAPCRTLAYAITQTGAGGEITVLDPAGYGTVIITKALSIVNDGVGEAAVSTNDARSSGISVEAGPHDVVNLRGLTIEGEGGGNQGIFFESGGALHVQNCVIRDFVNDGIYATETGTSDIHVTDTIISNNRNGIVIQPGGNVYLNAAFERVQAVDNTTNGFFVDGSNATGFIQATAADSVADSNDIGSNIGDGFIVSSAASQAQTQFTLVNSKSLNNAVGLFVATGAKMVLYGTVVAGSAADGYIVQTNGTLISYGNNSLPTQGGSGNGGTVTVVSQN